MAQIYRCDYCKKAEAIIKDLFLITGTAYDSMEGHYDTGEHIDLCGDCGSLVLEALVKSKRSFPREVIVGEGADLHTEYPLSEFILKDIAWSKK